MRSHGVAAPRGKRRTSTFAATIATAFALSATLDAMRSPSRMRIQRLVVDHRSRRIHNLAGFTLRAHMGRSSLPEPRQVQGCRSNTSHKRFNTSWRRSWWPGSSTASSPTPAAAGPSFRIPRRQGPSGVHLRPAPIRSRAGLTDHVDARSPGQRPRKPLSTTPGRTPRRARPAESTRCRSAMAGRCLRPPPGRRRQRPSSDPRGRCPARRTLSLGRPPPPCPRRG